LPLQICNKEKTLLAQGFFRMPPKGRKGEKGEHSELVIAWQSILSGPPYAKATGGTQFFNARF